MQSPKRYSTEAFELRKKLEKQVEEGTLTKESVAVPNRTVKERNMSYNCVERHDEYKDLEGNLNFTAIHFIDESKNYHSFYINSYTNGFGGRTI